MSKTTITYMDIAPGAQKTAVISGTQYEAFSRLTELRNEHDQESIATLEHNLWVLDGSFDVFDDQLIPFWSNVLSDADGNLNPQPTITVDFPTQYSTTAITLVFDELPGARASDINIKWYRGNTLVTESDFQPTESYAELSHRAELYSRIVITFRKTPLSYRRVRLRQIIFGIIRKYGMDEIRSARITNQTSHISVELPISSMDWTLDSKKDVDFMFQFKQPVRVENDDFIIGMYYINESERVSKSVYNIRCQNVLGVLDSANFPGGVYANYSAKQLFSKIVGEDFEIDFGEVRDVNLTGLLEPMTRRMALQHVLFGWGACAATDGGEVVRVFDLKSESEYIGYDRTYTGVSVETVSTITALSLTAHDFKENENGSIMIGDKKYSDTKTVYTINNADVTSNTKSDVIEIEGSNFINPSNVAAAARRCYDYYMKRNTVNVKIVWHGELIGDCIEVPDAWGGAHVGNIEQMDITLSNTVAAITRAPCSS